MTVGSLCSGYEGWGLALGAEPVWVADNDPAAAKLLAHRLPGVPNLGDITAVDWTQVSSVDTLTAGYPCQPFSHAGKRKGSKDERHIWPHVADAVGVLRPRRVLLENVAGHVSLGLADVLADLAALGYDATWGVVRAADAGAAHGRARVFIAATDARGGSFARVGAAGDGLSVAPERGAEPAPNTDEPGPQGPEPARRHVLPARCPCSRHQR